MLGSTARLMETQAMDIGEDHEQRNRYFQGTFVLIVS